MFPSDSDTNNGTMFQLLETRTSHVTTPTSTCSILIGILTSSFESHPTHLCPLAPPSATAASACTPKSPAVKLKRKIIQNKGKQIKNFLSLLVSSIYLLKFHRFKSNFYPNFSFKFSLNHLDLDYILYWKKLRKLFQLFFDFRVGIHLLLCSKFSFHFSFL